MLRHALRLIIAVAAFLIPQSYLWAGSLIGKVKFSGVAPKKATIKTTKDQDYCGVELPDETYLIGPGGGLKNVVLFIDNPPKSANPSPRENILDNQGCRFVPRVMAMRLGERLIVKNGDPKLHIVHSYLAKRTVFNLSLPFRGQKLEATNKIKNAGVLQVNCDAHAWMRAYIHVFGHPFFAVTDENGAFSIPELPAGAYTMKAWHEQAGVLLREVTVGDQREKRIRFEFGKGISQ